MCEDDCLSLQNGCTKIEYMRRLIMELPLSQFFFENPLIYKWKSLVLSLNVSIIIIDIVHFPHFHFLFWWVSLLNKACSFSRLQLVFLQLRAIYPGLLVRFNDTNETTLGYRNCPILSTISFVLLYYNCSHYLINYGFDCAFIFSPYFNYVYLV